MYLNNLKVAIFDVDGTLYDQSKLRKKMLFKLLAYYALRVWRYKDLLILYHFRAEREKRTGYSGPDLQNQQYEWCAAKLHVPQDRIRKVVNYWIFDYPNRHLLKSIYPGVSSLFSTLRRKGIKVAIYSDYKAHEKMQAMNLHADIIVSSTDAFIDRFKPDPAGINYILNAVSVLPEEALFIGDRDELDGSCARNAGIPYLILEAGNFSGFFSSLEKQIEGINTLQDKIES